MSYSSYRVSFGTSQTCLRVQGRLEAWKFRGLEAWLSRWGSAPHPYNSSVARLPGALFSVAVEGLALRACTLCSPFSGAALAAPPPSNQPVAKKHLHLGGICCYSIVTHWVSQCNGLCKRTKDIVRNVGTFGYLSWVRVHCVTCPRRGDIRGSHGHRRTTTTGTSFRPMPPTPSPMPPRQPSPQAATANKTRNKDLRTAPRTLATALSP